METIVTALIPVTFVLMLVLERVFPGRALPRVRGWLLKGFVFFVIIGVLNALLPAIVGPFFAAHAPLHLTGLGTVGGAIVAFLVGDLLSYGIHRVMHNVPTLWRWTHQIHHSAERIDIAGAVYFHPFDLVLQIVPTTIAVSLLGLSADAGALAGFIAFATAMFQHANIRTPQWLGYVIQRPEAHAVHHARGVHAYNYGNFMLWDLVLGTFRNPATFGETEAGFWDGASSRLGSMLIGRDVSTPEEVASARPLRSSASASPPASTPA
jgi:sterol desaturase/sphingolipid hydroxylase (fatty acid hydroxylase superfamily)